MVAHIWITSFIIIIIIIIIISLQNLLCLRIFCCNLLVSVAVLSPLRNSYKYCCAVLLYVLLAIWLSMQRTKIKH
jgi:hypothetical protein